MLKCHGNHWDAKWFAELGASKAVLEAGYNLGSMMKRYALTLQIPVILSVLKHTAAGIGQAQSLKSAEFSSQTAAPILSRLPVLRSLSQQASLKVHLARRCCSLKQSTTACQMSGCARRSGTRGWTGGTPRCGTAVAPGGTPSRRRRGDPCPWMRRCL